MAGLGYVVRIYPQLARCVTDEFDPRRETSLSVSLYQSLLFRIDKTSLGVSRIGVATPRDDCPYAKSNANTFVRARAYRVFLTLCVGKPYTNSPPSSIVTVSRPPGRHSRSLPSSNWPTLATFSPADTKHVARSLSYSVRLSVVAPFAILGRHRRKITTGSSSP